jgi:YfiH family protein
MPQEALNLAGFNEDDAQNIYENRRRFLKLFAGEWLLTGCWQVHGVDVRVVHNQAEADQKPGVLGDDLYCDALISKTPNVLLAVKTADCVPVLIGDPITRSFAAVHAGWRGTVSSIVKRAIEQLESEYGAKAANLSVAIGPAANACCYEVGSDVIAPRSKNDSQMLRRCWPRRATDMPELIFTSQPRTIDKPGVRADRIYLAPFCTMDRNDLFFSYRQEKRCTDESAG